MSTIALDSATLVESLRARAAKKPEAEHLLLLPDDDGPGETLSFAELLRGAGAVADGLRATGIEPHQTVALMLPTGQDFFFSFLGVLLAGAVPVPIYPPVRVDQIEEYAERQTGILRNAGVRGIITVRQAQSLAGLLRPKVPGLESIVTVEKLMNDSRGGRGRSSAPDPTPSAEDLALIQYTSGSTGDPKGVTLTHANLIANIRSIGAATAVSERDVVVSWLPLYHDMGLIGCWLFALCYGLRMVCFSPLAFLRQPKRWLRAISDYRGTLSPAPNFAYELCLRRVRDRDLEDLDLSSWRWALNGAEPINPQTIERFCERFRPLGFRDRTMKPVYGLAEAAVALTFPAAQAPPRIDRVERERFQLKGRAVPVPVGDGDDDEHDELLAFVAVGRPIAGNEIRLVDDDGELLPERIEGNIEFRGPSATPGYYRNKRATAEIRTPDGWTRTGDRGYLADGDLFITGRVKDLIIKAGRNIHPAEVESFAADVEGIRRGCVAAFGIASDRTGSEKLVVVAETRLKDPEARKKLASEVRRRVSTAIKVAPDVVELVAPRTVPKTPSGKLRRLECRERFLAGALTARRPPVWLQIARLSGAAAGTYLLTRLWRRHAARTARLEETSD